jgi:glycosyltransferase involved in cell wall biosynthesis
MKSSLYKSYPRFKIEKWFISLALFFLSLSYLESAEKPFVIIVASYNNEKFVEKNIRSILIQKYRNYRVVYFDDASTDHTYEKVAYLIKNSHLKSKFRVISNVRNKGAMHNHYSAISSCKESEIVVILDGDDWFAHDGVLSHLNQLYQDPNTWMTWGNYVTYPGHNRGLSSKIRNLATINFRKSPWVTSHLRSFYAGLFHKIDREDFFYDGHFLQTACDLAEMFPMLEMAREHAIYIPQILYIYNFENSISDHTIKPLLQTKMTSYIRSKQPYQKLTKLF